MNTDADPRIRIRIRIQIKMIWIRNTGVYNKKPFTKYATINHNRVCNITDYPVFTLWLKFPVKNTNEKKLFSERCFERNKLKFR